MTAVAIDTSAAVPFVMRSHQHHPAVRRALSGYHLVLTAHSLAETYSVLTRLPGDARLTPGDAVRLLDANFGEPALPATATARSFPAMLATAGIAGGAVYDALVGLAARDNDLDLVTRDKRAASTYAALGLPFTLVPT